MLITVTADRLRELLPGQRARAIERRAVTHVHRQFDSTLLAVAGALLAVGIVMVYSASVALPEQAKYAGYGSTHWLARQLMSVALGLTAAMLVFAVPVRIWQQFAPIMFIVGLLLLVLVLVPMIGKGVNGARRWLPLGFFNLQPSELMKLLVILYAADYTVRKQDTIHRVRKGFVPIAIVMALVALLVMLEPDMGATIVLVSVAMGILFLGGINGRLFTVLTLFLAGLFTFLLWAVPWRRARFFAYLDPFDSVHAAKQSYQLSHSLIAFGRGELFGVGLGGSVEKLHYLPEAHTDFLLAVIGEELGLIGVVVLIVLFYWLIRRAFEIGRQAIAIERVFAGLAASGVGIWFGVQGFINMGVNLGLLPTKGLTLPLMSYGGSGVMCNCIAVAMLLRIDYENRRAVRGVGR